MDNQRKRLIQYLAGVEKQLIKVYGDTYRAALEIAEVRKSVEAGDSFTWKGNPAAERKLDQYLSDLSNKAGVIIGNGVQQGYKQGEKDTSAPIIAKLGKTKSDRKAINEICEAATKERRAQGMTAHAYATAERGGLTISGRVWNMNGNAKLELETIIQNGILEGKGAKEIASGIKGYLNNPSALFRRVRNKETGNLELSEAAKKYHPGQGVYRSAYKNALRLVVTEMNAAYRRATWESIQNNPLVTSYEIRLSNEHTTTVKGKVVRLHDICDKLAGVYPKTFLWTGWHPQCRCSMNILSVNRDGFKDYIRSLRDSMGDYKPKEKENRPVAEVPKQLTKWQNENKARLLTAKSTPQFLTENKGLISLSQQQKALSLFSGSLQQFADAVIKAGKPTGQVKQIGRIDETIKEDMAKKGVAIETETIVIPDSKILRYLSHPKANKGATIDIQRYGEIEATINAPEHIYEDIIRKELVYVYTSPYEAGKVLKVIVQPNYNFKGVKTNLAKSWGIVDRANMEDTNQYRKIK